MEVSLKCDAIAVAEAATRGLGFGRFVLCRHSSAASHCLSVSHQSCSAPEAFSASGILAICAGFLPVDAVSPPTIKFHSIRTPPRGVLARRARRTRRKPLAGEPDDGEEFGGFFGDGDDGPFGGGGGGGGWNHDRDGGADGGEGSAWRDPAFDFVYEVLCWIVLSNCVHFAFKKFVRNLADGIGHSSREKVPVPLVY